MTRLVIAAAIMAAAPILIILLIGLIRLDPYEFYIYVTKTDTFAWLQGIWIVMVGYALLDVIKDRRKEEEEDEDE